MPALYMMFSVLSWSLFPLLSVWGIGSLGIFDYILLTYAAGLAATLVLLFLTPGFKDLRKEGLKRIDGKMMVDIIIGCVTVVLSFACLLVSFSYMSKAGATVVYEAWPILAMYITPLLIKKGWETISRKDLAFSLLALVGIGFLLYPEIKTAGFAADKFMGTFHLLLPLLGGALMAVAAVMKSRVSHLLENKKHPIASLLRTQAIFSACVMVLSGIFALIWPDKPDVFSRENILIVVAVGVFIHTLGNVAYTMAILRSAKPNIVALWYLMPVFSVVWLWLAKVSAVTEYIVWGSIFIITSNLIMTIRADRSKSYVATLIGLLVCGLWIYFTNGQEVITDYYQATSVPLFFYAILVAFMMERLIDRDRSEESLAIEVINYIDEHVESIGKAASAAFKDHITGIITGADPADVARHYQAVRNANNKHIRAVHNQLDQLALSKAQSTSFSEMFTLFMVGALTVVMLIIYRPHYFIADGYSIVLALAVIFVFFTVLDLCEQRHHFYLSRNEKGEMQVAQDLTANLAVERAISMVLVLCVLAALMGLLWVKHMGDKV